MKCPNCGAIIKDGSKFCEFCGDSITANMKRDQEYVNKAGCPKCGSSNIKFEREKQGEVRGKKGTAVVRATVGFCGDCGYTWHTAGSSNQPKKNNMLWWVLGWIFFFPAPVMVLIWRKKCKWDIKVKIGVTVAFWLLFFIIGGVGGTSDSSSSSTKGELAVENTITVENPTDTTATDETPVVDDKTETPVVEEKPAEEVNIAVKYDNDFIASAKMTLDRFITNYDLSLAPQKWTIAKFDDTDTLIGMTDITYQDRVGKFIFVGTLNIENDKVTSVTPHYIEVNGEVLGDDSYCDDVFNTIKNLGL